MSKVYIFGPINLFGEDYLPVYKHLRSLCQKYFDEVICTYPDFWDSKESPQDFYDRTYKTITKCDLFIGELSSPSIGVGMEFQMAQEHNIPCIILCKKGVKPSIMAFGIPCAKQVIYYETLDDLSKQIEAAVQEFK
ncbi:MAG: hypothetical protein WCT37_00200 [Patescibacteria group bacterium]|jgi:hypothetical protein